MELGGYPLLNLAAARALTRVPGLRRLPIFELVIAGEVVMLAKAHYERLTPSERRRLVVLVRDTRGRPGNLSASDRRELQDLITKVEPRLFAMAAAQKLAPLRLSRRR